MGKKKAASTKPPRKKSVPPLTRDVGTQSKGPRLQKLRALLLLVQTTIDFPDRPAQAAVELFGDVSLRSATTSSSEHYVEENKNYDSDVAFTMNSPEVTNTLVAFCDSWIAHGCSENFRFGFYCPNAFTTERNTDRTKKLQIQWPDKAVLEHLSSGAITPEALEATKRAVIAEYSAQATAHSAKPGNPALGNLDKIQAWSDAEWRAFLKQVQWKFGQDDEKAVESELVNLIQASPFYNQQLAGKEHQIIAVLLNKLDSRQSMKDPILRFMHVAEVQLAFKDVESGAVKLPDPMWEAWTKLPAPTDSRNIDGKATAICPTVSPQRIARWSRRAAASMIEQRALDDDKQVLALKFQLYDACEEKLSQVSPTHAPLSDGQLQQTMTEVLNAATTRFQQCKQQYHYKLASDASVEGMVYELFDSCYLSFDENVTS